MVLWILNTAILTMVLNACLNEEKIYQYTVIFNINYGYGTPPEPITVEAGYALKIPLAVGLTNDIHVFDGWAKNADGIGTVYKAGDYFTPDGNTILYAVWVIPTVTFRANGGIGTVPEVQKVNAGTYIRLPGGNDLHRSGFKFRCWNTNAAGTGNNYIAGQSFLVNNNVVLYAKWERLYTVIYTEGIYGNGNPPEPHEVESGELIVVRRNTFTTTNESYRFNGWYSPNVVTSEGTRRIIQPGEIVRVNGHITFSAQWTR